MTDDEFKGKNIHSSESVQSEDLHGDSKESGEFIKTNENDKDLSSSDNLDALSNKRLWR